MRIVGHNINGSFLTITKKPIHRKKEIYLDMNLIRPNINLGLMNPNELENIYKSIYRFFKLKAVDVYFYNYNLLNTNIHSNTILNTKYRLVHIYKHLVKVFEHGNIYFSLIKHNSKFLKRKIFIKELPLIRPDIFLNNIEYTQNKYSTRYPSYYNQELTNFLYNFANPSYIDIFSHFLCSRLVEEDVSPHFPLFYGVYNTIFSKFTHKFESKSDFIDFIEDNNGIYKSDLYSTICHDDINKYKVTYNNFPVCLMATEVMDYDLGDFIEDDLLINKNNEEDPSLYFEENITSILFQTIAALSVVHNFWELYHNDLHLGNIMFKNTTNKYIYYYFKNTYYKVPTFGKVVKIIDWNRATMKYNGVQLNNLEYTNLGDCRDMYRFQNSIDNQKKKILPNPNFDLAILAYEILNIAKILNKKSKLYKLLIDWTNMSNGDNIYSHFATNDDNEADFHLYVYIAKYCNNCIPVKQITKPIFTQYKINKSDIPKNEKIYIIA
jgi:hypothetical protein